MGQTQTTQFVNKIQEGAQSAQTWKHQGSVLDISRYSFPKENILLRMQENLSSYAISYVQVVLAVLAIKCFTDLLLLVMIILSSVGWYMVLKNQHLLDLIPGGQTFNNDKKLVLMFLCNLLLIYIFDDSIFTFIGIGCALVLTHSLLAISPSTQPPNEVQNEFNQVLIQNDTQYKNTEQTHIDMPEIEEYSLVQKK